VTADLSVSEAARQLGVSSQTIREWFDAHALEGYRNPSNHRRILLPEEQTGEHLTVSAAARLMGCSAETVRQRFDQGRLAGYRLPSGQRRIARTSAEKKQKPVP
jgi:excisionase family DNA binding protein